MEAARCKMLVPLYQSIESHTSKDENRQHTTFLSGTIFWFWNQGLTKSRNCRMINLYFLTCSLSGLMSFQNSMHNFKISFMLCKLHYCLFLSFTYDIMIHMGIKIIYLAHTQKLLTSWHTECSYVICGSFIFLTMWTKLIPEIKGKTSLLTTNKLLQNY